MIELATVFRCAASARSRAAPRTRAVARHRSAQPPSSRPSPSLHGSLWKYVARRGACPEMRMQSWPHPEVRRAWSCFRFLEQAPTSVRHWECASASFSCSIGPNLTDASRRSSTCPQWASSSSLCYRRPLAPSLGTGPDPPWHAWRRFFEDFRLSTYPPRRPGLRFVFASTPPTSWGLGLPPCLVSEAPFFFAERLWVVWGLVGSALLSSKKRPSHWVPATPRPCAGSQTRLRRHRSRVSPRPRGDGPYPLS